MKKFYMLQRAILFRGCSEKIFRIIRLTTILLMVAVLNVFGGNTFNTNLNLAKETDPAAMQQLKITGTVTDEKGNSLPGVTVLIKGTTLGTLTDASGKYTINDAPQNATLIFSFVGMSTQEISSNGRMLIDVVLKEMAIGLEEVVVIGYGTQKKVNLTGAVSTASSEKLSVVPTQNVATLLYGNLPGLIPVQRSGEPGKDDVLLSIRGFSNALVVVDGVVGRDFTRLNPNEIESISILKDAASAAVYGVSGGNGVILVTTKRGNIGKPVFNYTMDYGANHNTYEPKIVNSGEYALLMNESDVNLGGTPRYTQEEVRKFGDGSDPLHYHYTDWYKLQVRDYPIQQMQNISVRGGSEKIKYYFLLGQSSQDSHWNGGGKDYKKYNFRSNVDASITDNLLISVGLGGRITQLNDMVQGTTRMYELLFYEYPVSYPFNPDGKLSSSTFGVAGMFYPDMAGYINDVTNTYESSFTVDYKIPFIKGLSVNLKASYDMYFRNKKDWEKKLLTYSWDEATQTSVVAGSIGVSQLILDTWKSSAARITPSINYERTFATVHNVKALLLYEESEDNSTNFEASRKDFVLPIDQIFAGPDAGKNNTGGASDNGRQSYVGRINYDYSGKYLFEYSFRYDGSAKFPPATRWGYFSGISAGWRISQENFIKNNFTAIDNLKLRGSWGTLGSDNTGNFQFLAGYTYPVDNYILGNSTSGGLYATGIPNPNITWESSQLFDLGVDMSLWKRLLEIEGDIFYRKREGLLTTRASQLPITFGADLPAENLNSDDARGFEIILRHRSNIGEIKYMLSTNLSYSRIKSLHMEQTPFYNQNDNWRANLSDRWQNQIWGYKAVGQFQSYEDIYSSPIQDGQANSTLRPGDIKYQDFNKDGVISSADNQIIGRGFTPELNYGFSLNAVWKKFSVDINLQGASLFSFQRSAMAISPFYNYMSCFDFLMDRWHRADPTDPTSEWIPGKYPATVYGGAANNKLTSDFWTSNVTYLRVKSLSIRYNLESAFLKSYGVQGLTVSLSGQNLWTLSSLSEDFDPEAPSGRLQYYPQQKTYNFGVNITF